MSRKPEYRGLSDAQYKAVLEEEAAQKAAEEAKQAEDKAPQAPNPAPTEDLQPEGHVAPPDAGVAPTEPVVAPEPKSAVGADQDFEQKFKSLSGRFRVTTEENRALKEKLAALEAKAQAAGAPVQSSMQVLVDTIAALRAEISELKGGPNAATAAKGDPIERQIADEFGEEQAKNLMGLIERIATQKADQKFQAMSADLNNVKQGYAKTVEQAHAAELDRLYPGWRDVRDDPEFSEFLEQEEGLTGMTYRAILEKAASAHDAARTVKIYEKYRPQAAAAPKGALSSADKLISPPKHGGKPKVEEKKQYTDKDLEILQAQWKDKLIPFDEYEKRHAEISRAMAKPVHA